MGLDKRNIPIIISVGTGKFCLNEALLMSTHKICFCGEIRKTEQYFLAEQSTFNLSFDTLPSPKYCYTITRIIDNIFLVFFFFLFFFLFLFFQEIGFNISCKLSPFMKYPSLFSGKNEKIFQNVSC